MNLAQLFTARPAPVKGGRIIKGYAMSGSKESVTVALATDKVVEARKGGQAKAAAARLSRRDEKYLPHLKDWTTTATIAALVGTSPASAVIVLKRMVLERLVDMRRKTGPKGGAAVRYEWKAKDQRGLQLAMQRETHCERGLTAPTNQQQEKN